VLHAGFRGSAERLSVFDPSPGPGLGLSSASGREGYGMVQRQGGSMFTRAACLFPVVFVALTACGKMDPQECKKLRDSAFELINTANMCTADPECKESEWPGCSKPINVTSFDKIHGMMETFVKGKCEEPPKANCQKAPKVYCQEGICGFRYKPFEGEMKIETK
jgi:hypothetical protein